MPFNHIRDEDELPHERVTASRHLFGGRFLDIRVDDVVHPSGRPSQRVVIDHPGSVVIVAITEDQQVLLIRQYRHAIDQYVIELPGGLVDPGEDPLEAARRELVEETSYAPAAMTLIAAAYTSPGYTTEKTAFVLAEGCVPVEFDADPDEPIRVTRVPVAEIPNLLVPGETRIVQAQAMIGLLWLLRLRGVS